MCHIVDNTNLYLQLMRKILAYESLESGKRGYYLGASGSVAWMDMYTAFATALARRGTVDNASVYRATDEELHGMGVALGCPDNLELVPMQLGGR